MRVIWILIHSRFFTSISILNILKGILQPMFGPLIHVVKWLQAEFIIYDHCTSTVKRKLIKLNCSDIG